MPRHRRITECRHGGAISKLCSCEHCTLFVCALCGAYEGSLTTDCPGERVGFDRQREVCETKLDYTDGRGWHQGESMKRHSPDMRPSDGVAAGAHTPCYDDPPDRTEVTRFARINGCLCGWRVPPGTTDFDEAFLLHVTGVDASIDWATVTSTTALLRALAQKAIAWALADRVADKHSVDLVRVREEVDACLPPREGQPGRLDERVPALLQKLEGAKIGFHRADQRAVRCDEEFRQVARKLVAQLEKGPSSVLMAGAEDVGESAALSQETLVDDCDSAGHKGPRVTYSADHLTEEDIRAVLKEQRGTMLGLDCQVALAAYCAPSARAGCRVRIADYLNQKSPIVHILSQEGQPYSSERRCCNHCGSMIWGALAPLHVDNWVDWRANANNCGRKAKP
jgi:hypothetical protein